MQIGVCYHPELWVFPLAGSEQDPQARWREDAKLMADAGISIVRLGENSWAFCEQTEGKYDFTWLRQVMDILGEHGIEIVLATPTSCPPLWLLEKHPEILPIDQDGLKRYPGSYKTACLNSDIYWEYCKKIVREMALALGDHPKLKAWQIDNDLGEHQSHFTFNEDTKRDWAFWLEAKYETIEKLNNFLGLRWGGQIVKDWKQVPPPMRTVGHHNPTVQLDWTRFCSDTVVHFVKMQAEILREVTPEKPITVNISSLQSKIDHFDLAEVVHFVSGAVTLEHSAPNHETAMQLDRLRSLKLGGGTPGFWIMAQNVSIPSYSTMHSYFKPGLLRSFTYQCIARGASAVIFTPWRSPRFGHRQFQGGILPHHVRRENRIYREVAQVCEEFKLIKTTLEGTAIKSPVAIIHTYDNQWANELASGQQFPPLNVINHAKLFYSPFYEKNIPVDFVRPLDDLSRYRLLIAPSLRLLSEAEAEALISFVRNGGVLVSTCNTGLVDEHNLASDKGFPHSLHEIFGLEVVEFELLRPEEENHLIFKRDFPATQTHPAKYWCDIIEPKECEIVATFAASYYAGRPAITLNEYGNGKAIYIGTVSHRAFYADLFRWLRDLCGLNPPIKTPETVEVTMRESENTKVYLLINKADTPAKIQFLSRVEDLITGTQILGQHELPPYGVLIAKELQS